jgi:hypothetical protein
MAGLRGTTQNEITFPGSAALQGGKLHFGMPGVMDRATFLDNQQTNLLQ